MALRPLHDRVLVRRLEEQESKLGSIIIPDSAKEKPQQAEVMAVGNGKLLDNGERVAIDLKAGDRILFGKYSGSEIKIEGDELSDPARRRDSWSSLLMLRFASSVFLAAASLGRCRRASETGRDQFAAGGIRNR